MSTHAALNWQPESGHPPYSQPISLAPYLDDTINVVVEHGQIALVLRDHEVRGVLMQQGHAIKVREDAPEYPGELSSKEERINSALENLHDEILGIEPHRTFSAADTIVFLSVDLIPHLELADGGYAALRVDDPVVFYESFLRQSESLRLEDFTSVARALVEDGVEQVADEDPAHRAASRLRTIGLDLVALHVPAIHRV